MRGGNAIFAFDPIGLVAAWSCSREKFWGSVEII
jgi:hypothetical protein